MSHCEPTTSGRIRRVTPLKSCQCMRDVCISSHMGVSQSHGVARSKPKPTEKPLIFVIIAFMISMQNPMCQVKQKLDGLFSSCIGTGSRFLQWRQRKRLKVLHGSFTPRPGQDQISWRGRKTNHTHSQEILWIHHLEMMVPGVQPFFGVHKWQ